MARFQVHPTYVPNDDPEFEEVARDALLLAMNRWDEDEGIRLVTERLVERYPDAQIVGRPPEGSAEQWTNDVYWTIYRDGKP